MAKFVVIVLCLVFCVANSQVYRGTVKFSGRQAAEQNETATTTEYPTTTDGTTESATTDETTDEATTEAADNAPYPAAGYKPSRLFLLPTERRNDKLESSATAKPSSTEDSGENVSPGIPAEDPDSEAIDLANGQNGVVLPPVPGQGGPGYFLIQLPTGVTQKVTYIATVPSSPEAQPILISQPISAEIVPPRSFSYVSRFQRF